MSLPRRHQKRFREGLWLMPVYWSAVMLAAGRLSFDTYRENWHEDGGVKGYHEREDGDGEHNEVLLLEWFLWCCIEGDRVCRRTRGDRGVLFVLCGGSHNGLLKCSQKAKGLVKGSQVEDGLR